MKLNESYTLTRRNIGNRYTIIELMIGRGLTEYERERYYNGDYDDMVNNARTIAGQITFGSVGFLPGFFSTIEYHPYIGGYWIDARGHFAPVWAEAGHCDTVSTLTDDALDYEQVFTQGWVRVSYYEGELNVTYDSRYASPEALRSVKALVKSLLTRRAFDDVWVETHNKNSNTCTERYAAFEEFVNQNSKVALSAAA